MARGLTICTGWSPSGWHEYGEDFVRTFRQYAAPDVKLVAYVEESQQLERVEVRQVRAIPGCGEFLERHEADAAARGRAPAPSWKERDQRAGYNWRFDAVKFCRQAFIPDDAAARCETDHLAWFDGDVRFLAPFDAATVTKLLPVGCAVAYLGRGAKHSEIGFQLYRVPDAAPLLRAFRFLYSTDQVFQLKEWHSAFAWDHARRLAAGLVGHDLTPGGHGHVWHQSPLRFFSDHLKGDRKAKGRSPEARRA